MLLPYQNMLLFLSCAILFSCGKQKTQTEPSSSINKEKIDAVFRNDLPNVLLDHLYVVVDSSTYARITTDDTWKSKYASLDQGLPDFSPVGNYATTCYLRGHRHYIEILGPKNNYDEPIGKSGIGFSLKDKDKQFHLGEEPDLNIENGSFLNAAETVMMPLNNDEHVWFKAFYTPSSETALQTWYAYYNPTFLDNLNGSCHQSYSREAFLMNTYKDHKLFNGIREIYLNCTTDDYYRIAQELRYLRCKLLEKNEDVLTIAGDDITIHIKPSKTITYSRITKIVCELNSNDYSNTTLGNLTIINRGTESIWNFDELHNTN